MLCVCPHAVPAVQLGLSIKDMFSFCMAPASASDLRIGAALLNFATKYRCEGERGAEWGWLRGCWLGKLGSL